MATVPRGPIPDALKPIETEKDEINVLGASLIAANRMIQKYCNKQNDDFLLCKTEDEDPAHCVQQGKAVTRCGFDVFKAIRAHCNTEFNAYSHCIDWHNLKTGDCRTARNQSENIFYDCLKRNKLYP
eukprot:TRINITY_DN5651_c0_g1_i1.p1 TRINITY_DN5651_c0_g1~~TRINITY_DN5651_c0_g1_i1.p1  ORF type:complete len:142 (-),score=19.11 TRINITY_DN5651_c0_g1_i1:93-473(-)